MSMSVHASAQEPIKLNFGDKVPSFPGSSNKTKSSAAAGPAAPQIQVPRGSKSLPGSSDSSPIAELKRNPLIYGRDGEDTHSLAFLHRDRNGSTASDGGSPMRGSVSSDSGRPSLIRKKSGELVKSSLKLPTLARPRSMPNAKVVHFASDLEHVRRFNHTEQPSKVSFEWGDHAGADYGSDDDSDDDWSISTPNFTVPDFDRVPGNDRPIVYMDSLFLSPDKLNLKGSVCVRNVAFNKSVAVRYTIDYWQSLSEVEAHYSSDIRRRDRIAGYDRFTFQIPLAILPTKVLKKASMFMCLRYRADGNEFWDNNSNLNYEVIFKKGTSSPEQEQGRAWPAMGQQRSFVLPSSRPRRSDSLPLDNTSDLLSDDYDKNSLSPSEIFASVAAETQAARPKLIPSSHNNGLRSRYSFGAAFNQPLRAPDSAPVQVKNRPTGSTVGGPQAIPKGANGPLMAAATNKPLVGSPPHKKPAGRVFPTENSTFTWDSSSYQDILSKYCFAGAVPDKKGLVGSPPPSGSPVGSPSESRDVSKDSSPRNGSPPAHDNHAGFASFLSPRKDASPSPPVERVPDLTAKQASSAVVSPPTVNQQLSAPPEKADASVPMVHNVTPLSPPSPSPSPCPSPTHSPLPEPFPTLTKTTSFSNLTMMRDLALGSD